MSLSWWERIWPTRKTLQTLDGGVTISLEAIRGLLGDKRVSPDELKGKVAWGQYLDEAHRSDDHWGRFGTSAAVIALALINGRDDLPPNPKSVYAVHPLDRLAPVLAESWPPPNDADSEPGELERLREKDFKLIMKLAYVLDALKADFQMVRPEDQPQLVEYVISKSPENMEGWTTRAANSSHGQHDRHIPTTYILWALRRFPAAQEHPIVKEAYDWLAREIVHDNQRMGIDLVALAGLAMQRATAEITGHEQIQNALARCDEKVERWIRKQKHPTLERPYFNGFSQGTTTDYIILSPELLCTLYQLDRGNPPRTRRFVLEVVAEVNENVAPRTVGGPDGAAIIPRGFCVQNGMIRTADQMWVVELLKAFRKLKGHRQSNLLPPRTGWLTSRRALVILALAALVVYIGVMINTKGWSEANLLAIAAAIALLSVNIFFELANTKT